MSLVTFICGSIGPCIAIDGCESSTVRQRQQLTTDKDLSDRILRVTFDYLTTRNRATVKPLLTSKFCGGATVQCAPCALGMYYYGHYKTMYGNKPSIWRPSVGSETRCLALLPERRRPYACARGPEARPAWFSIHVRFPRMI